MTHGAPESLSTQGSCARGRTRPRRRAFGRGWPRALWLAVLSVALELLLISPWVDHAAERNDTVHFTQHGLIYLGGIAMGWALCALWRAR